MTAGLQTSLSSGESTTGGTPGEGVVKEIHSLYAPERFMVATFVFRARRTNDTGAFTVAVLVRE